MLHALMIVATTSAAPSPCACVTEPWTAGVPSANCSLLIDQTCFDSYLGECPLRLDLGSYADNRTELRQWLNASASTCGTLPIFTETALGQAVYAADQLILEFLVDPAALAAALFLNASTFGMPATSYQSVHELNGTAFLQLGRAELAGLGLTDDEVDVAVQWRVDLASGCACVTEAGRTGLPSDYYVPSVRCVAQLRATCVLADARGEVCPSAGFFPFGLYLQSSPPAGAVIEDRGQNYTLPMGSVKVKEANATMWVFIIVGLARTCPGGKAVALRESNSHSSNPHHRAPPTQIGRLTVHPSLAVPHRESAKWLPAALLLHAALPAELLSAGGDCVPPAKPDWPLPESGVRAAHRR